MANVTFTSPRLNHDITVYAVAGDTHTLLAVAQKNEVPLSFICQNGGCGACAIKVTVLSNKAPMGVMLTEKEKVALKLAGKVTPEQIAAAENSDVPPPWRLACQFIVRNEDILVSF